MGHIKVMSVSYSIDYGTKKTSSMLLIEIPFFYDSMEQLSASKEIKYDINILCIFEDLSALDDIGMVDLA